ncbi:MAG: Fe-S cluster assembly protein SufD, partial [Alphaproteobacteria bacterium]
RAHIAAFSTLAQDLPGASTQALADMRSAALARFTEAGLPTGRLEDWKFTRLDRLANTSFAPSVSVSNPFTAIGPDFIKRLAPIAGAITLVFVNGRLQAGLSTPLIKTGIRVSPLADALNDPGFKAKLATGDKPAQSLIALNTAFMTDGALIKLSDDITLEAPVVLLFLTGGDGHAAHSRNVLTLGARTQARVIEIHASLPGVPTGFSNTVTDIALGNSAALHHLRIAAEAPGALHHSFADVTLAENAHYYSFALSVGGELSRQESDVYFAGTGGHAALYGAYLGRGHQHMDHTTRVYHDHPGCTTDEIFKGALDDHAHGVFQGLLRVAPHAIKTDARQKNTNLLLSDHAVVDTKPELEILADDVKCAHGATVGDLDSDELFYLCARGIAPAEARRLLIAGYIEDLIERLGDETLATVIRTHTDSWLAGGPQ